VIGWLTQGALTSRPDWMRRHRLRTLRNICLPGSHQSATYTVESTARHLPLAIGWTRCQRHDIAEQLHAGIRFLDVSVTSADDDEDGEVTDWMKSCLVARICGKGHETKRT